MATNIDEAGVRFTVDGLAPYLTKLEAANRATVGVGTVAENSARKHGIAWGTIGAAAGKAALAVGVAALAIGASLLKIGAMFDKATDHIRIATGKTGAPLKALEDDFKAVFTSIPTSADKASSAIAFLNQKLGLTGQPLQDLSVAVLELSRLTGTDLTANMDAAVGVFEKFKVATADQVPVLDAFLTASQQSGIGVDALMQSVTANSGALHTMGFTLPQSIALIGSLGKAGIDTDKAMIGLRLASTKFAKEGIKDPQAELQRYIGLIGAAGTTAEANAIGVKIFGKSSIDMVAAIRSGKFDIGDFQAAMDKNKDSIAGAAAATDDWPEKLNVLKNQLLTELEPAASAVFGGLADLVDQVKPHISELSAWFDQTLKPALEDVIGSVGDFWSSLSEGQQALLLFGPIGLAVEELKKHWDDLQPSLQAIGDWISMVGLPAFRDFSDWVNTTAIPALEGLANFINDKVIAAVTSLADWFTNHLVPATQEIVTGFRTDVLPVLTALWQTIKDDLQPQLQALVTSFNTNVAPALGAIGEGLQKVGSFVRENAVPALKLLADAMTTAWTIIKPIVEAMIKNIASVGEAFGAVVKTIQALTEGDWGAAWSSARDVVMIMIKAAIDAVTGLGQAAFEAAKALWELVVKAVDAVAGDQVRAVGAFINDNIIKPIESFYGVMAGIGKALFEKIKDGAVIAFGEITGWIGTWLGPIASAVSPLFSFMYGVGAAIMGKLWDGLKAVWSSISDWISGLDIPWPDITPPWRGKSAPINWTIPIKLHPAMELAEADPNWLLDWFNKKNEAERLQQELRQAYQEWLKTHPLEMTVPIAMHPDWQHAPRPGEWQPTDMTPKDRDKPPLQAPHELHPLTKTKRPPGGPDDMPRPVDDQKPTPLQQITDPGQFLQLVVQAIQAIETLAGADIKPVNRKKLLTLAKDLRAIITEFGNAMKGVKTESATQAAIIAGFLDPILQAVQNGIATLDAIGSLKGGIPGVPRIKLVMEAIANVTRVAIADLGKLDAGKLPKTAATAALVAQIIQDMAAAAAALRGLTPPGTVPGTVPGTTPGTTPGTPPPGIDPLAAYRAILGSLPMRGAVLPGAPGGVSYNVSAVYSNPQDPGSIRLDLYELAMRASA